MIVLGINDSSHHNTSAAIVRDGELLAAVEEERLSRIKIDNAYPEQAIQEVLALAGLSYADVDIVALANLARHEQTPYVDVFYQQVYNLAKHDFAIRKYYWKHQLDRYLRRLRGRCVTRNEILAQQPSYAVEHHLAHAASAYFPSPFAKERVAVITLDGAGDFSWGSIFLGDQGKLTSIARYPYVNSIGLLYTAITIYLGFKPSRHEGKVLGLAAYGNPEPLLSRLLANTNQQDWAELFNAKLARITLEFHRELGQTVVAELCQGLSKEDVAAGIQAYTEQMICNWIQIQVKSLKVSKLALAGGVFANVKLNQQILALPEVDNIYVHPNMGDGGLATGAAFEVYARLNAGFAPVFKEQVYLGTEINRNNALQALQARGIKYLEPQDLATEVAKLLAAGKVVARADGKMEYGPRALGNRSVMAAANDKSINQWLNNKFARTEFMPFAPVILEAYAHAYFPDWQAAHVAARFMTLTYKASAEAKQNIPAAVHIDGTARPQVLQRAQNAKYFDIIFAYQQLTGVPSIINTSFNMHEEPIVRTADEAISAFISADLDALILGPFLVLRNAHGIS